MIDSNSVLTLALSDKEVQIKSRVLFSSQNVLVSTKRKPKQEKDLTHMDQN